MVKWGNVAEWAAAIGTVGALFAAITVVVRDRRRRFVDQAEKVNAWVESYRYTETADERSGECRVAVKNASDLPAYDCVVELLPWNSARGIKAISSRTWPAIGPNTDGKSSDFHHGVTGPPGLARATTPPIRFTYRHGSRLWQRDPKGNLRQLARWWWQGGRDH